MKKFLIIILTLVTLFIIFRNVNFESEYSNTDSQNIEVDTRAIQSLSLSDFNISDVAEEEKTYLNIENSTLVWIGENKLRNVQHTGELDFKSDSYVVLDENGQISSGLIQVDMTTLRGNNEPQGLINHLRSNDFFDVEKYNNARLDIISSDGANVEALLTIKDITQEVDFVLSQNEGVFTGLLSFDRSLWNISTLSRSFFSNLGDSIVEDMIVLDFTVILQN
jgi:hypothetical protein